MGGALQRLAVGSDGVGQPTYHPVFYDCNETKKPGFFNSVWVLF